MHGLGATSSFWLPQIRGLFNLDKKFTDQELLDLFTLSIPGHPKSDKKFDQKWISEQIKQFAQEKGPKQSELAKKLVLSHPAKLIQALQEPRLILIGHSMGGMISLLFSLKNPSWVSKIVLISCGNKFNTVSDYLYKNLLIKGLIMKLTPKQLKWLIKVSPNLKFKVLLDILAENPRRLGFCSGLALVQNFNFEREFSKISLNQQLAFMKIPILAITGNYDAFLRVNSVRRLGEILSIDNPVFKAKKTIIETGRQSTNFTLKTYSAGHHPMDADLVSFVYDVRQFLDGQY
jgi:pimeloyl-ACP methyl ester carboxylesterase